MPESRPVRVAALISGAGSNMAALIDAGFGRGEISVLSSHQSIDAAAGDNQRPIEDA